MGSQEQGAWGPWQSQVPDSRLGLTLTLHLFPLVLDVGQVLLQLTVLSWPGNLQVWGESTPENTDSPSLLHGSHLVL